MNILFLRHGPTAWNAEGRVQGQTDIPLSDAGRAAVRSWRLPPDTRSWEWHASPLRRAVETAGILGIPTDRLQTDGRLKEVNWGDWEGAILSELRAELGDTMRRNEARGLDMAPPNGESPRQLAERLRHWLQEIAIRQNNVCVVCHAGILRAAYTIATGWDMRRAAPLEKGHDWAHLYTLSVDGNLAPDSLNICLTENEPPCDHGG
ncbi:MAG: histidine phosphatase family protein [Rhodospirillaceae bacterium]|nr:histidine phosphatase family protein [Rhodospirillaceae bacterium]